MHIPHLQLEIPPLTQRGGISTVEGLLSGAAKNLRADQPIREATDPAQAAAVGDVIAALLETKLSAPEWQRRLKALSLVEALIKEDDAGQATGIVRAHFSAVSDTVEAQLQSAQASLKEKARKVLEVSSLS